MHDVIRIGVRPESAVHTREETMRCTSQDNTARAFDPQVAARPDRSPGGHEVSRRQLTAVQAPPGPTPLVARESTDRSNRVFNRLVGLGLSILVLLLAAVLLYAGINVEVLP